MSILKSVPRPEPGAGVPKPKGEYIYLYDADDIETEPTLTLGQKTYTEGFKLKANAKGIKFYATSGTIEPVIEKVGETDAVSFKSGFKFSYPGEDADGVIETLSNKSVVGFIPGCNGAGATKYGSKCLPLRLQALEATDNNEVNKRVITLQQTATDKHMPIRYTGELPPVADLEPAEPPVESI